MTSLHFRNRQGFWLLCEGKIYVCTFVIDDSYPVPPFSDFSSLDEKDYEKNNQLAFDIAEREFGISPCMTGKEMSSVVEPDKLSMVMYLSQFYEMFKDTVPPGGENAVLHLDVFCLILRDLSVITCMLASYRYF